MLSTPKSLCTSLIASLSFGLDTELSGGHLYLQVPQVPQTQWVPKVFSQKPFFSSYVANFHSESLNWRRASPLCSHSTHAGQYNALEWPVYLLSSSRVPSRWWMWRNVSHFYFLSTWCNSWHKVKVRCPINIWSKYEYPAFLILS